MTGNTWIPQAELWIGSDRLIDAPSERALAPFPVPATAAPASAWRPQAKAQERPSRPARRSATERPSSG